MIIPKTSNTCCKRYNSTESGIIKSDVYFNSESLCDAVAENFQIKCGNLEGSYSKNKNSLWLKSWRQSLEISPPLTLTVPQKRIRDIRSFKMFKYLPMGVDLMAHYIYPDEALEFLLRYLEFDISDQNWEKISSNKSAKLESKLTQKVQFNLYLITYFLFPANGRKRRDV